MRPDTIMVKAQRPPIRAVLSTLFIVVTSIGCVTADNRRGTGVWLDDKGAYRDLVVAIHPSFVPTNCTTFFHNLQETLNSFSLRLWRATSGRVHVGGVGVIVPHGLSRACTLSPHTAATWHRWSTADLRVSPGDLMSERVWGVEGSLGVGVSQPEGCGRPGHHISLDADILQDADQHHIDTLGRSLVGGWARYRWGVFEERGYENHPRFPPAYLKDNTPVPTTCTNTRLNGHWQSRKGSSRCRDWPEDGGTHDEAELRECTWVPDITPGVQLNSSLLYRADLPQMWGFCDNDSHDPDAPTPHNLLCEARSVWDIIQKHPDFSHEEHSQPIHDKLQPTSDDGDDLRKPNATADANVTVGSDNVGLSFQNDTSSTTKDSSTSKNYSSKDVLYLDDVRKRLKDKSTTSSEIQTMSTKQVNDTATNHSRRKRSEQPGKGDSALPVLSLRPSLVTAHIATSTLPPTTDPPIGLQQDTDNITVHQFSTQKAEDNILDDIRSSSGNSKGITSKDQKIQATSPAPSWWPPDPPELVLLSPAPRVVILALDLSDEAVKQINVDDLRGGILRWLWGLGDGVKVGVLAAYNNASYPLTLGPLLPAPTSISQLEDELNLLPSVDEVEDGLYGGKHCLDCVLAEAAAMLKKGGIEEGGVLFLAACSPIITPDTKARVEQSGLTLHTLVLCPSADPKFDELAGVGGSWLLPGPPLPTSTHGFQEGAEQRTSRILTRATRSALAAPGDPQLVRIGGRHVEVGKQTMVSGGAYSTMTGSVKLPSAKSHLLVVITTQYQAKIIEVISPSGEVDIIRDTNQRFLAVVDDEDGDISYTLKFLTSSIVFPFFVAMDIYERRFEDIGIEVTLHTNNNYHIPLEPGSQPLVVWAEVTLDGRPVVGAKVMLTVSHLSEDGSSTDMMLELLDNGNAEPDVRSHDGVYTRYVTWLPGEGRYALTASASDHHGAASVLAPRRTDGLVVPVSAGQFAVTSAVVSLNVLRVAVADLTPPSRVTDLAITSVHDTTINLTWSAPGGDLDQGSAWRYELKMYTERSALSEGKFNTSTIAVYCISHDLRAPTQTPASYGTPQHCLTEIPFTNLRWYFAIRAIDASNNTGRISNIVSAFVPEPPTTLPPTPSASEPPSNAQTVIMSTVTSLNPRDSLSDQNSTHPSNTKNISHDWRVWVAVGVGVGGITVAALIVFLCICCCRRSHDTTEKDPDRPIYKIYVNNAYIQEEDGEIKVVSNGKLVDDKEPSQVQEWVNSLSKFGSSDAYNGENGETPAGTTEAPLVECRPRASMKYASPVRFGVLTNGSIMRDACASSSSTSSSKPSEDPNNDDFKYRDLSETTSNSTTDGGASASSAGTTEMAPPPPSIDNTLGSITSKANSLGIPPPPPPSHLEQQPLGIPGPTVISIHSGSGPGLNTGYSSDEEGGFRPRALHGLGLGPGPRRYLPNQFSSFRYLPPPPEYRSTAGGRPVDYPCHTISRATATLPHGTVRSVKKRRHISFV